MGFLLSPAVFLNRNGGEGEEPRTKPRMDGYFGNCQCSSKRPAVMRSGSGAPGFTLTTA